MLDGYFELLRRRNSRAYAVGMFKLYSDIATAELMSQEESEMDHSFPIEVRFVPMVSLSNEESIILAEQTRLSNLLDFLEVEFFRGLAASNAPRRCHNCRKRRRAPVGRWGASSRTYRGRTTGHRRKRNMTGPTTAQSSGKLEEDQTGRVERCCGSGTDPAGTVWTGKADG